MLHPGSLCISRLDCVRYAISSHTGIEQHVQYQSLERMLLQAFGLEKIMPP